MYLAAYRQNAPLSVLSQPNKGQSWGEKRAQDQLPLNFLNKFIYLFIY